MNCSIPSLELCISWKETTDNAKMDLLLGCYHAAKLKTNINSVSTSLVLVALKYSDTGHCFYSHSLINAGTYGPQYWILYHTKHTLNWQNIRKLVNHDDMEFFLFKLLLKEIIIIRICSYLPSFINKKRAWPIFVPFFKKINLSWSINKSNVFTCHYK